MKAMNLNINPVGGLEFIGDSRYQCLGNIVQLVDKHLWPFSGIIDVTVGRSFRGRIFFRLKRWHLLNVKYVY